MTLSPTLPDDILSGMPTPTQGRWQPQRAGIAGLFHYDAQVFTFYRGRLLLRGNNGNGKSMALEVLLPFVLVADTDPSQLSTFGNRNRSMYTWLLGHDPASRHAGARGYVWVEFARLGTLGQQEYFTVGAGLEAVRAGEKVTPWYFTTAARIGVDLHVGTPGGETPSRDAIAAELQQLADRGLPGDIRTPKNHRAECNRVLFGLPEDSYRSLLKALRQLRRPKLSDKLSQKALGEILRDSLPSLDRGLISAIATGYERLDRHQDDIKNLRTMITGLRELDAAYQRYARACLWQRAHAITACQQTSARAEKKAHDSAADRDRLAAQVGDCERLATGLTTDLNQLDGRLSGLRATEFYTQGNQLQPLLDQAKTLELVAAQSRGRAKDSADQAGLDADAAREARTAAETADAEAQHRHLLVRQGAQLFTLLRSIYDELNDRLGGTDAAGSQQSLPDVRSQLRQAVADLRGRLQTLGKIAAQAAEAARAADVLAEEKELARIGLVDADELAAAAGERLRSARDEFIAAARTWMAQCDQLTAADVAWHDVEPARMSAALGQWRDTAHRTRIRQLNVLVQRFTGPSIAQPQQGAAQLHQGYRELIGHARDASSAADAAHRAVDTARGAWLQQLTAWAAALTHLHVHGPAMPAQDEFAPHLWRDWADAAVQAHHAHISAAEQELLQRQRTHDLQHHQCRIEHQELAGERDAVAAQVAMAPPVPPTRLDSRHDRTGAPLYLLVDFIDSRLDPARIAGLEAALIGSGLADAWLHPDGLLYTADGAPLADTQLNAKSDSVGRPLTSAIRPDTDAAHTAGVPVAAITAVLAGIGLADTAEEAATDLTVGWDGTWRAGPLHGAYRQHTAGLIGAASRERARKARLAELDQQLAVLTRQLVEYTKAEQHLADEAAALATTKEQARAEAASLPATTIAEHAAQRAHDADQTASQTLERANLRQQDLHAALVQLHRRRSDDLTAVAAASPVPGEHRTPDLIENLTGPLSLALLDDYAQTSAAMLDAIGKASDDTLSGLHAAADTAGQQHDAFPDTDSLRRHEQEATQAEQAQTAARRQFNHRSAQHQKALTDSAQRQTILDGALAQADLALWATRLGDLPPKVDSWTDTAEDWLRAISDHRTAMTTLNDSTNRAAASAKLASKATTQATTDNDQAVSAREHYTTLANRIGTGYTTVMAEVAEVQQQISDTAKALKQAQENRIELSRQHGGAQIRASNDADAYAQVTGELPKLSAKLWAATGADLPRAAGWQLPATSDDADADTATAVAQVIQELAGTDAANQYGPHHNDDLTSAVFGLRHQAETSLSGRLTLIERYAADILVVEAARDSATATLPATIADLNNEVISLQTMLNTEEAKLLEQFLTDSIRRQVTGHIEAAREQITDIGAVMQQHRTSAGYRFTLKWIPAAGADVDNRVLDLLDADFAAAPSAKERLREFFAARIAAIRATKTGQTWEELLQEMLDYRRWYQFELQFAKGTNEFAELNNTEFDKLSGGEKSVALHLPLFAAAATHTVSATVRDTRDPAKPGCPRLILLDEVFAGVDEDMRGELFDLVTSLDMDLVATSEAETGMYAELDGIAIYHLIKFEGVPGVLAARSIWTGTDVVHLLDNDLEYSR